MELWLKNKDWNGAIYSLNEKPTDEKSLMQLSLVYQILALYREEEKLVKQAALLFPLNAYFYDRILWHNKPIFEKLVPRKSVSEAHPYILPNVAFVSCTSCGNFNWLVELLESIQNTISFKKTPHCIVDIGLLPEQIEYIMTHFPIFAVRKPDMLYFPSRTLFNDASKANHCYPFFHNIFPEFDYLCHIETDMWIQDESVFNDIFSMCKNTGFVLANMNTGLFCTHKNSELFQKWWGEYYKTLETIKNPSTRYAQEPSLRAVYTANKYKFLNNHNHNYLVYEKGIPLQVNDLLIDPWIQKRISSFHIHRYCTYAKEHYFVSIPETIDRLYIRKSQDVLKNGTKVSDTEISLRYRTWPWRNKESLIKQLEAM